MLGRSDTKSWGSAPSLVAPLRADGRVDISDVIDAVVGSPGGAASEETT